MLRGRISTVTRHNAKSTHLNRCRVESESSSPRIRWLLLIDIFLRFQPLQQRFLSPLGLWWSPGNRQLHLRNSRWEVSLRGGHSRRTIVHAPFTRVRRDIQSKNLPRLFSLPVQL